MEDKKLKKIRVVAVSASVLTAGTVALAAAYQAGISFAPSGKESRESGTDYSGRRIQILCVCAYIGS